MKKNPLAYFVGGALICAVLLAVVTRDRWDGKSAAVETASATTQAGNTTQPAQTGTTQTEPTPSEAKPEQQAAVEPQAETEPEASAQPAPAKPAIAPTFDIVTVAPDGIAVIAGRAEPGAQISVMLGGQTIGEAIANDNGEWVLAPEPTLPAGSHSLSIVATTSDGLVRQSDQAVAVAVAEKPEKQPLIVLSKPSEPSKVLQKPGPEPQQTAEAEPEVKEPVSEQQSAAQSETPEKPAAEQDVAAVDTTAQPTEAAPEPQPEPAPVAKTPLSLDTVDYNDTGDIIFSGKSDPGGRVRIYVDNQHVGDALADASGRWFFKGNEKIAPGLHRLRIDQVQPGGAVVQRRELPFERAEPAKVAELQSAQTATAAAKQPEPAKTNETKLAKTPEPTAPEPAAPEPATPEPSAPETAAPEPAAPDTTETAAVTPAPEPAAPEKTQPAAARLGRVVIQPGNNLWNISRVIYGRGIEYTTIYEANRDQIRNPHRIYPGQIFATPGAMPPEEIDPARRDPLTEQEKQTQ